VNIVVTTLPDHTIIGFCETDAVPFPFYGSIHAGGVYYWPMTPEGNAWYEVPEFPEGMACGTWAYDGTQFIDNRPPPPVEEPPADEPPPGEPEPEPTAG
jgi:hypothetical protein